MKKYQWVEELRLIPRNRKPVPKETIRMNAVEKMLMDIEGENFTDLDDWYDYGCYAYKDCNPKCRKKINTGCLSKLVQFAFALILITTLT